MEVRNVQGIHLFYEEGDGTAADLVEGTLVDSMGLMKELWGLDVPARLRVYVMRSWFRFYMHATPWLQKPLFLLSLPVMAVRLGRIWPFAGGWNQPFIGGSRAVGIKPPDLLVVYALVIRLFIGHQKTVLFHKRRKFILRRYSS